MLYTFRIHFASRSLFDSREGIEMECKFHIKAENYETALKSARIWEQNLIKKNPSIKLMGSTCLQFIDDRQEVGQHETDSE